MAKQKADALEHNISLFSHKMALANQKADALEMLLARLIQYLKGTMNYGILYNGFPAVLKGYSDANWISDSDEIKSTSSYVFTLGGGALAWKSSIQTLIATFTMESKFIALESAGKETEWLRNFLS